METPRDRRLRSDFRALSQLKSESTIIDFQAFGNPPDRYRVILRGPGVRRVDGSGDRMKAVILRQHEVEITFGSDYPRNRPQLQWKSEIFHPNISGTGLVCLGGYTTHWVPSLNLDELVEMLWDMVRFANFDVKSPYNMVAARWASTQKELQFPLDARPIRDRAPEETPAAATPKPKAPAPVQKREVWDAVVSDRRDVVRIEQVRPNAPEPPPSEEIVFIEPESPRNSARRESGDEDILIIE